MKTIPLTNGGETMVDDADYRRLSQYRWHLDIGGYVIRSGPRINGHQRSVFMHREVLRLSLDFKSDHWDGNPLNNQRANLRVASPRQNSGNAKLRSDNRIGFKGVSTAVRKNDPYYASICDHGVRVHLGIFPSPEQAAQAYDEAARRVFGTFARVNFPLPGEQGCRAVAS
jgi:hypothetical protein